MQGLTQERNTPSEGLNYKGLFSSCFCTENIQIFLCNFCFTPVLLRDASKDHHN